MKTNPNFKACWLVILLPTFADLQTQEENVYMKMGSTETSYSTTSDYKYFFCQATLFQVHTEATANIHTREEQSCPYSVVGLRTNSL